MTHLSVPPAEKMREMISLAMIVKNEEKRLARAIRSVGASVGEIVVVDTGSEDGTASLARDLGAKVLFHEFTGDFSAARNISISACRGDWILVLDADEFFPLSPRLMLETATDLSVPGQNDYKGYYLLRQNYESGEFEMSYSDFVLRLFRNDRQVRYCHRVHETLEESLDSLAGRYGQLASMPLSHYLFERDLAYLRSKPQKYIDGLLKDIAENPKDAGRYDFLGCEYVRLGKLAEAERAFLKLLELDPQNAVGMESLAMVREMMSQEAEGGN